MDAGALLQALRWSAAHGSPIERLAALRLAARISWPEDSSSDALKLLSNASPSETESVSAANLLIPPPLRGQLEELLASGRKKGIESARVVWSQALQLIEDLPEPPTSTERARLAAVKAALGIGTESSYDWPDLHKVISYLPPKVAEAVIVALYARLAAPDLDEGDSTTRQDWGNMVTALAATVRHEKIPQADILFSIYTALFAPAFLFWTDWLTDHAELPSWIPASAGNLSVSWQLAWAASASSFDHLANLVTLNLRSPDAYVRFAALQFAETAIRFAGAQLPLFAPDTSRIFDPFYEGPQARPPGAGAEGEAAPAPAAAEIPSPSAAPEIVLELQKDLIVKPPLRFIKHAPEPMVEPEPASAPARHADFKFYSEFPGGMRGPVVEPGNTLQAGSRYQLEVAVRAIREGIPSLGEAEPIREPGQKEPVKILVVADSPDGDFEIPEPVQQLSLPPAGDSRKNAWFRGIVARRRTNSEYELLQLRIRLYYNLNLLEVAIIEAEAVSPLEDAHHSRIGLEQPVRFRQILSEREYRDLDLLMPRSMHIQIAPAPGGFHLAFLLQRPDRPDVLLPGTARISEAALENSLCEIRKSLLGITVWDAFNKSVVCGDEYQFARGLHNLARLGRELWTKIFEIERDSSLFQIGDWLWNHPLPSLALIQISTDPSAQAFVMPWNLLYDRHLPDDPDTAPDIEGFWGVRYQIEQRAAVPDTPDQLSPSAANVDIGFLTWPFEEVALQRAFLNEMVSLSNGRLAELHLIDSAQAALSYLSEGGSNIICFFAHGHTQFREASQVGFSESDFVHLYESLPPESNLKTAWKDAYEQIKQRQYESDRSWIQLRSGRLYLLQLYQKRNIKLDKQPIVLLNMCESAQLTPSLRESFIHFFLDHGAIAVIGTECSMRPLFAHHFAKELLERLLSGGALGEAMLDVRRHFLKQRNPLGLAYTLFGSPLVRFDPALLERQFAGSLEQQPVAAN